MTMRPCWSGMISWASAMKARRAPVVTRAGVGQGLHLVGGGVEALDRPQAEAAVELAEQPGLAELGADLGRQHHPTLVVESVVVGPDEAGPLLCHGDLPWCAIRGSGCSLVRPAAPQDPSCVPLRATVCHYPTMVNHCEPLAIRHPPPDVATATSPGRATGAWNLARPAWLRRRTGVRAGRSRTASRRASRGTRDARAAPASAASASTRSSGGQGQELDHGAPGPRRPSPCTGTGRPARVRRCDRPTSFTPASSTTSPVPSPPKQTRRDQGVRHSPPSWTRAGTPSATERVPPRPRRARGRPGPRRRRHSGSPAGQQHVEPEHPPGSTSTAPPPLRRRATSTPAARAGGAVDDVVGLAAAEHERRHGRLARPRPSARAGRAAGGRGASAGGLPVDRSTAQVTPDSVAAGGGTAPRGRAPGRPPPPPR